MSEFMIGWASTDITPDQPVLVTGQFHARVSEGVKDPVTATVLALESRDDSAPGGAAVMVSCDLVVIPDAFRDAVRAEVKHRVPELDPCKVFLGATHTHTGPEIRVDSDVLQFGGGNVSGWVGVDLPVLDPADYVDHAATIIADAVAEAWQSREPGGVGFGLGHAVVGFNRRIAYVDGTSRMYGITDDPHFSHVEGYEDHGVNVLGAWNARKGLTGVIVNVACPAQVEEGRYEISADYWHDTRVELRRRLGKDLFVLPQNSASGDQSPHVLVGKTEHERMWRLAGRTERQDIAVRIADAVTRVLPIAEREAETDPPFAHKVDTVELSRRHLTPQDVENAQATAAALREKYEAYLRKLEAQPEIREEPRWYKEVTSLYRRMRWNERVADRFKAQEERPKVPVEIHVLRLGDVAIATNPFELYVDYGMQIKARSKAVQTFLVQHVGSGTYLPTARSVAGGSYGAVPASTPIGPEGGRELVSRTVELIDDLWQK